MRKNVMSESGSRPPAKAKVAGSVDEYLARLDEPERTALAKLRAQIRRAAPKASEVISYQIPTYRQNGPLVHFAAQPGHLSFTVVSLEVVNAFRDELRDFDLSGRTIRFSARKPLPAALVKRIVEARVLENDPGPPRVGTAPKMPRKPQRSRGVRVRGQR